MSRLTVAATLIALAALDARSAADPGVDLFKAIATQDVAALDRALAGKASPDTEQNGLPALILAAYTGRTELVTHLLRAGADANRLNVERETALHSSAKEDNLAIVKALVAAKIHLEQRDLHGRTGLMVHAQEGHTAIVGFLLSKKADPNVVDIDGLTALQIATANGHTEVVKALLAAGADPQAMNLRLSNSLGIALEAGNRELVSALLARADVRAAWSPLGGGLATAIATRHPELVPLLLARHPPVDEIDGFHKMTPLQIAAALGSLEAAKALIDAGAKLEIETPEGLRALHVAAFAGHLPVVQLLVEKGAAINATNKLRSTAVRAAADAGHKEIVVWLLAHGAKPAIADVWNKLPADYARANGHADLAALLEKAERR